MADIQVIILAIIIGTLFAIIWSLRVLVLMERRVASIDENLLKITGRIFKEEMKIERGEKIIERAIKRRR